MLDSNHDELKSIASCKAVSLVAGDPQAAGDRANSGGPDIKLENEVEIKSYQQDWKNMPSHLNYRHDDNSLQQLVWPQLPRIRFNISFRFRRFLTHWDRIHLFLIRAPVPSHRQPHLAVTWHEDSVWFRINVQMYKHVANR